MEQDQDILIFKILIVGAQGVGKSSLFLRYTKNNFMENMMTTIGFDMQFKQLEINKKLVKLQIWDAAGDPKFENIQSSYYKGAHAVVVVFDITSEYSFEAVSKIQQAIEDYAPKNALLYLIGNKSDLESKRVIKKDIAMQKANENGFTYFETSAKTSANVDSAFNSMAERLVDQVQPYDINNSFKLQSQPKKDLRENKCCSYY